jgi:L,D-transpeptidase YbiS
LAIFSVSFLTLLSSLFLLLFFGTGYGSFKIDETVMKSGREHPNSKEQSNPDEIIESSDKTLSSVAPTDIFIVIDRVHNRLWLHENDKITLEAKISAGAGSILKDPKTKREWTFDTPTGRFKVKGKREQPLWTAPDWEFIEANEPYPKNYSDRTEEGMLGEYALDLDIPGYMIHGTLYERLIGRNVTHGCVRVGRDDLRILWKKVPIGSTVFIF